MRLLAASDIHIGRIPSLPDATHLVTGRSAWDAVVQCALDRNVDALLLAGDVVEDENAYFEAFGALLIGLERLKQRGIRVFAVAGNHDAAVFSRVARESDAIHLLGMGGCWESTTFNGITLVGWSFPAKKFVGNPLSNFQAPCDGSPWIGLLHCDLDGASTSPYAPVPATDLAASGGEWVLGHIHQGGIQAQGKAFYCGSPFALDSGEEGAHGAWLLTLNSEGALEDREQIQLSPWKFRTVCVSIEGVASKEEVGERVAKALREGAREEAQGFDGSLYCSLQLQGRCAASGKLAAMLKEGLPDLEVLESGVVARATDRIKDMTKPLLDLENFATGKGAKATLARLLLQLQTSGLGFTEMPGLIEEVRRMCEDEGLSEPKVLTETIELAVSRLLGAINEQGRGT